MSAAPSRPAALTLAVMLAACAREQPAATATGVVVDVAGEAASTAGRGHRVLLTGELEATDSVSFDVPRTEAWQLSLRWMIEDGSPVKAGERVMELDNSAFTQGLEEKKIAVKEAESALRTFRDLAALGITVKEHELAQQKLALARATLLASVPGELLPARTAQQRKLDRERAEVEVAKAQAALTTERSATALDVKVKLIEVEKAKRAITTAETAIKDLVMTAPRDGIALIGVHPWEDRPYEVGDMVQPGMTVMTMPDLSKPLVVRAELSDVDDGRIAAGAKGTCTLDAYPHQPVPCRVTELAPVAQSVSRESLRRVFAVKLALDTTNHEQMRPGMSVKVELPGTPLAAVKSAGAAP